MSKGGQQIPSLSEEAREMNGRSRAFCRAICVQTRTHSDTTTTREEKRDILQEWKKGIPRNPISNKHSNPSAPLPLPYYPRACLCRSIDRSPLHQASGPVPPVHSLAHAQQTHTCCGGGEGRLFLSLSSLCSGDAASHTHILPTPLDGWPELLFLSL